MLPVTIGNQLVSSSQFFGGLVTMQVDQPQSMKTHHGGRTQHVHLQGQARWQAALGHHIKASVFINFIGMNDGEILVVNGGEQFSGG